MRFPRAVAALLALSLGACAGVGCTLIGCASGLNVRFATTPSGAYHVEVMSQELASPRVFDCANAGGVCPPITFDGYRPTVATITVTYAGRTGRTEVHPSYEDQYPNGSQCGAACNSATVIVPLP